MLVRQFCSSVDLPRPRSFAGLMEMYEANYVRFRRLCPARYDVGDAAVSMVRGAPDLHLRIIARRSYTALVHLTYLIEDEHGVARPNPDLGIRIYYDARQAEYLPEFPGGQILGARTSLTDKWAANRFLYKWLCYCVRQGYAFRGGQASSARQHGPSLQSMAGG
jgi:uncharacterized protein